MNALVVCSLFWRLGRRGHNREGVIIRSVISVVAGLRQRTLPRRLFFLQPQHVRRAFSPPLLVHSPGSTMLFEAPSNIIENSEELAELWMCLFLASMRVFLFFSPWHRVCRVNQHWITSIIRIIVKAVFKAILMIQCKRLEHRYCWPTGRVAFLQIDFLSNFAVFYFILLFIIFSVTPVIWGTAAKTSYTHTELEGLFFFLLIKRGNWVSEVQDPLFSGLDLSIFGAHRQDILSVIVQSFPFFFYFLWVLPHFMEVQI